MDLVSIIIPAYNQAGFLAQSVRSALSQTHRALEVIVVDDGSTDDTPSVVRTLADPRLRYVRQENQGLSSARNTGMRASNGGLLSFLDADDLFLPDKLTLLVGELQARPQVGLVAGQAIPVDKDGRPAGRVFDRGFPDPANRWLLGNPLHVGSVLLRREWQERVGWFDETLSSYEDWDLWLRLARGGCLMGWLPRPVSLYRFHSAQMTRDGGQMTRSSFAVLDKVFRDPGLPESWKQLRDQAYSHAHLRAAAQAYLAGNYSRAKADLTKAVDLNPNLLANSGRPLIDHISAWLDLPKTSAPLEFLAGIYRNLPEGLVAPVWRRRGMALAARRLAFDSYLRGDGRAARSALFIALRHRPDWLAQRGILAMLVRSFRARPA
ncbi:MAG: hypothetical protein A2Y93_02910 [Chloroflexi bacterium RBG_13_68_17]|nr:MAG: hypothetical protein A2Y93_02910 [Chloroflexi bacterium RBG_13_68_17]